MVIQVQQLILLLLLMTNSGRGWDNPSKIAAKEVPIAPCNMMHMFHPVLRNQVKFKFMGA